MIPSRPAMISITIFVLSVFAAAATAQTPSFNFVGSPLSPPSSSSAYGLSADGRVAVGFNANDQGTRGFFWTVEGRHDFVPAPLGQNTFGVSGDGRVAVGGVGNAFRYTEAAGFQMLGSDSTFRYSSATAANQDGSVIVGTLSNSLGSSSAIFRWTAAGGLHPLFEVGVFGTSPAGVSRDGSVVVGTNQGHAFRWTQSGVTFLPNLPGTTDSYVRASNPDARLLVGSGGGSTPVLWRDGIPEQMPIPDGFLAAYPTAVNLGGSVIVGFAAALGPNDACVWTNGRVEQAATFFASNGVSVPTGWRIEELRCVSDDGLTFGGVARSDQGRVLQGFVATIPAPHSLPPLILSLACLSRRRRSLKEFLFRLGASERSAGYIVR